ncbi:MAG: phage holin family protein [Owenweeksia sp.]
MDITKNIKQLTDDFQKYIRLEVEHAKYEALEEASKIIGSIFTFVFILIFGCISTLLVGMFAGFYLAEVFDSYLIGFGVTSLGYIVTLILMVAFRKHLLEKPFVSTAVKHIFKHLREKQENKQ